MPLCLVIVFPPLSPSLSPFRSPGERHLCLSPSFSRSTMCAQFRSLCLSRVCSVALMHELRGQSDLQLAVTSAKPQRTQPFLIELLRLERVSNSSRCSCHAIAIKHCNIAILSLILVSSSVHRKLSLKVYIFPFPSICPTSLPSHELEQQPA